MIWQRPTVGFLVATWSAIALPWPALAQRPLPPNLPPAAPPPLVPGGSQPSFTNPNLPPGGFSAPVTRPNQPDPFLPNNRDPFLPNARPPVRPSDLSPAGTVETGDYILGGGDTIFVDVFQVPQYSGNYQIPIDGSIFMPLIGRIPLRGLTMQQASDTISAAYGQFLRRPIITLRLVNSRPVNVFISGEINRPGSYTAVITGGIGAAPGLVSGVQYPSLTQVIQQAGGISLTADLSQVQLVRSTGGDTTVATTINLQQILESGDRRRDPVLRDGDSIFIPSKTTATLGEVLQLANLGVVEDFRQPRTVAVVGQVNRPGVYSVVGLAVNNTAVLGGFPTVTLAIQEAGGLKPLADLRNVQLRRFNATGQSQTLTINLWELLQTGDITQDTLIQNGDTIIIPQAANLPPEEATALAEARFAPRTIRVSIVGEVTRPGSVELQPNTPLNQAILSAGGFTNDRANQTVQLVRLNPDGSVSRREIAADYSRSIDEDNNPPLRNQDIIIVSRTPTANVLDVLASLLNPFAGVQAVYGGISNILQLLGIFRR